MVHELADLVFKLPGQVIVLQVDHIFQGAVVALDLSPGVQRLPSSQPPIVRLQTLWDKFCIFLTDTFPEHSGFK